MVKTNYDNGPLHFRQVTNIETVKLRIANSCINNENGSSTSRRFIKENQVVDTLKFDLNNLVIATHDGVDGSVILAPSTSNTYNSYTGMAYYQSNDSIVNCLIVKSEIISDSTAKVTYYSSNLEPVQTLLNNYKDDQYIIGYDAINKVPSIYPTSILPIQRINGQAVADCISDAYSNHGWVSVALFVETAFIWQTAAAISIACAIKNRKT